MLRIARIPGFEGYGVTPDGKVWTNKQQGSKTKRMTGWRELPSSINGWGYLALTLQVATKQQAFCVHRLMAYVFLGLPLKDHNLQVNHKDGVKTNNSVENLEAVTASENAKHAWRTGLRKPFSFHTYNRGSK